MDVNWPAPAEAIERARAFLQEERAGRPLIVPDGDVDGLSSGLIAFRALERLGEKPQVIHPGKGEHVHTEALRRRIHAEQHGAVLIFDQGSRGQQVDAGAPTLVVDHHQPVRGLPPDATVVSSFGQEPVANTSWLAFAICDSVVDCSDLAWLAIVGTVGDLGADPPLPGAKTLLRAVGVTAVREAVALLNAPKRHGEHDVATAWEVLCRAQSPADIAKGRVPGVEKLQRYRREVREEVDRCAKSRPLVAGDNALLAFHSAAKVHPLVATRWTRRFPKGIVIAANYGYLPGKVNFVLRSAAPIDLLEWLHGLGVPLPGDAGFGHARATGGSLPVELFDQLLAAAGFGQAPALRALHRYVEPSQPRQ